MDVSISPQGSPMDAAYAAARAAAPGYLVLYRVGEFYEVLALAVRGSGASFSDLPGDGATARRGRCRPGPCPRPRLARGAARLLAPRTHCTCGPAGLRLGALPASLPLPRWVSAGDTVEIDGPTLRGLDVLTSGAGRDGSLLSVMDRTVTAPGARGPVVIG